mmetsp:Transcript_20788/g.23509  ORF Transcript_20788/g.23509 Transcript_20788/m.23509 type:complete len:287 (-) Transcript_20788:6-866(-)
MKYNMKLNFVSVFILAICLSSSFFSASAVGNSLLRHRNKSKHANLDRLMNQIRTDISQFDQTKVEAHDTSADSQATDADDAKKADDKASDSDSTADAKTSDSDGSAAIIQYGGDAGANEAPFIEKGLDACKERTVIEKCNETMCRSVKYMTDMDDYCARADGFLSLNMYTLSLFLGEDPSKLLRSMDLIKAGQPQKMTGAPTCFKISSDIEKKEIRACFETEAKLNEWLDAMQQFWRCKNGDDLSKTVVIDQQTNCTTTSTATLVDEDAPPSNSDPATTDSTTPAR